MDQEKLGAKENTKKSKWFYVLLIPIGALIMIMIFDFGQGMYFENKLKNEVKEIFETTLKSSGLETTEQYRNYAKKLYKEKGYDEKQLSFIERENNEYIVIAYSSYTKVTNQIFNFFVELVNEFGGTNRNYPINSLITAGFKGHYNEYKEVEIEEFKESEIEEVELNTDYNISTTTTKLIISN